MVLLTVSLGLGTESSLSGYTANRMLKACNKNKTDNLIAFFYAETHQTHSTSSCIDFRRCIEIATLEQSFIMKPYARTFPVEITKLL